MLYNGDCLVEHEHITDGSVDLILTDLPYGTMNTDGGRKLGIDGWDIPIPVEDVFKIANRVLRKNGKLILFSQEPYSTNLIYNAIANIPFSYRMIWLKDTFANALGVNKNAVAMHEDILLFSKVEDTMRNPAQDYTDKVKKYINKPNKEIFKDFEENSYKKYATLDTFNSERARRYNFPTKETYKALIYLYEIDKMCGYKEYGEAKAIDTNFKNKYLSTFNLWEGNKYKSNILEYKKDYNGYHPTQKPILLLEDLIKTFSNENDLVVDLTMGSGSTGVAALNTNRKFIGIELNEGYFNIAKKRMG